MKVLSIIIVSTFFKLTLFGQGFEYEFFLPTESDSGIEIRWVITAGSTCDGMVVEHSNDSTSFSRIFEVFGTCGSANFDIPYRYTHTNPSLNSKNYYRIRFGQVEVSEVSCIFIIDNSPIAIPNPAGNNVVVYFENPFSMPAKIEVYSVVGMLIESVSTTNDRFDFDISNYERGIYFYSFPDRTNLYGAFVKQ